MILVKPSLRKTAIATSGNTTATRVTPLTRTAAIVLALWSTKSVQEATSFRLTRTASGIELLVLVGWYTACIRWHHLRITHVGRPTGGERRRIRRMVHGPVRWQRTVLDRDSARVLLLLRLIEWVCRQVLLQLMLFAFSQLVLLVVEPLKNYGTSVSLQLLVLLFVVQVDHLPIEKKR